MTRITTPYILFIIIIGLPLTVCSQNPPRPVPNPQVTNPPDGWWLQIFLNNHLRIGGLEGGVSTFAYSVGLPVIWVEDQVKIVPMAGWFWNTRPGWSGGDAAGGKILYYFKKQRQIAPGEVNFYTGISSLMGSDKEHQTGVTVGVEPFFNRYLKLGFEVQLGLQSDGDVDRVYGGAGIIVGFGW